MKIVSTIEARMTSTRLPGKVLLNAANKPLLETLVERLKKSSSIDEIVLATTINESDDCLVELANRLEIFYYRGSEDDVMDRVIKAADSRMAEVVVEITGDCPLIDPWLVEQCIQTFKVNGAEYVSNNHIRSYPDGMDVQVFKLDALKRSASLTRDRLDHEHVTLHIRNNPNLFSLIHLPAPPNLHWPELGLTLDEEADYKLIKNIIEYFASACKEYSLQDIIDLLKSKPEWATINMNVVRKGDT